MLIGVAVFAAPFVTYRANRMVAGEARMLVDAVSPVLAGAVLAAALLAAVVADSLPVWSAARSATDLAGATALHALDRGAYAAGMWREMARSRDFRAIRPGRP